MGQRDKTELLASILTAASRGNVNAVQMMYKAFLSYKKVKQYVSILLDAGMITCQEGNPRSYRITDIGRRFLHLYNQLDELLIDRSSQIIAMN
jgi:predicted transcriptional regulator